MWSARCGRYRKSNTSRSPRYARGQKVVRGTVRCIRHLIPTLISFGLQIVKVSTRRISRTIPPYFLLSITPRSQKEQVPAGASTSRHKPENCLTPIRLLVPINLWQAEREKHVVLRIIFLVVCPDGSTKPRLKKCGSTTSSNGTDFASTSASRSTLRYSGLNTILFKGELRRGVRMEAY